jgi:hypothetical protein
MLLGMRDGGGSCRCRPAYKAAGAANFVYLTYFLPAFLSICLERVPTIGHLMKRTKESSRPGW